MAFSDKNFRQTIGRPQESNRLFPSVLPIIIAVLSILIPKVPVGHLFDVVPAPVAVARDHARLRLSTDFLHG